MSAVLETQKAVYAVLSGDATLAGMVSGVYDHVPEGASFPYVTIGDVAADDKSALGEKTYLLNLGIAVYSRGQGRKECLNIMEQVRVLLDEQDLEITGFAQLYTHLVSISSAITSDGLGVNGKIFFQVGVRV